MMDVVPPVFGGGDKGGRKNKMPGRKWQEPPNVLRVDWRPPARVLGRTGNLKLSFSRPHRMAAPAKPQRDEWLVQRRDVSTKVASKYPPRYRGKPGGNNTYQKGTGSAVWGQGGAGWTPPPYGGNFPGPLIQSAKKKTDKGRKVKAEEKGGGGKKEELSDKAGKVNGTDRPPLIGTAERDAPYLFNEGTDTEANEEGALLQLPRRWWSLTPGAIPEKKREIKIAKEHKKFKIPSLKLDWRPRMLNLAMLLAGLVCLTFFMGNLVQASSGISAVLEVQDKLKFAYGSLMAGGAALAETRFEESEKYFNDAEDLLTEAEEEVNKAAGASGKLIDYLDITGMARTSEEMLEAGRSITTAGQRIARGASLLVASKVWEPGGEEGSTTLTDAVKAAREEFIMAAADLEKVEAAANKADSVLLPEAAAQQVALIQQTVPRARLALQSFIEQSDLLLMMLGEDHDRQYLVLFQNNHELRPTGGFIGTVGLVGIDRGVVEEMDVRTVYDGDGQLKELIEPPQPLKRVSDRWYLRDSNWFIDFPISAKKAAEFLEKEGGPTVDGVIAMTPDVIRELLTITGPIEMPDWGITVDAESFRIIAQHEVTYGYDRQSNEPKKFLADLTPLLLTRLFAAKETSSLEIMNKLVELMNQKKLLLYFQNDEVQERLEKGGWSGSVPADKGGFVGVVNANIAGHKSDQFIEQELEYDMRVEKNGEVEVLLTIKREHRGPDETPAYDYPPSENPAEKDNIVYQRVLVPEEAELVAAGGWTAERDLPPMMDGEDVSQVSKPDADVAEWERGQEEHESGTRIGREADYRFFANWVVTKPGETSVAWYKYRLPEGAEVPGVFDPAGNVEAYIFKQPGDNRTSVRVSIKLPPGVRVHTFRPEEGYVQTSVSEATYQAKVDQDILLGAVLVKD